MEGQTKEIGKTSSARGAADAAELAFKNLFSLLGKTELANTPTEQVHLEEIERTEDNAAWMVTLSYPSSEPPTPIEQMTSAAKLFGTTPRRRRKVLTIGINDGELISMRVG